MSKNLKSNRVLSCAKELDAIKSAKTIKQRKNLIRKARDCVIDSISEIALNCLKGNIPLKSCDFNKLKKFRNFLRRISSGIPIQKRRKLIIQKGGQILPILISNALGYLGSLAFNYLKQKLTK